MSLLQIQTGKLYVLTSSVNLRSTIGNFYNIGRRDSTLAKPIFSLPYIDFLGLGKSILVFLKSKLPEKAITENSIFVKDQRY